MRLHSGRRLRRLAGAPLIIIACLAGAAPAAAGPRTLGWLEWAWLEPGHVRIKAKLDTGARTSSIDAADIEPFERDGEPWVRFRVPLASRPDDSDHGEDLVYERRVLREVRVKDHLHASHVRYVVRLRLCVGGLAFFTPVTLADRSRFNYPLLLGRLALQGRYTVDAARKFTADHSCRASSPDTAAGADQ